jgi:tricorn protease
VSRQIQRLTTYEDPFSVAAAAAIPAAIALAHPRRAADATSLHYYRFAAVHGDTIVFTADGDLWRVGINGGVLQRLTTIRRSRAAVSPDGTTMAFCAAYE